MASGPYRSAIWLLLDYRVAKMRKFDNWFDEDVGKPPNPSDRGLFLR